MLLQPLAAAGGDRLLRARVVIPELYAQRGANSAPAWQGSERARAAFGWTARRPRRHEARELHARTGLVLEPGRLGGVAVGEAAPSCCTAADARPSATAIKVDGRALAATGGATERDRIATPLLALRETSRALRPSRTQLAGARWRLRRRMRGGGEICADVAAFGLDHSSKRAC